MATDPMDPATAVTWGPFIQAAYEQFVSPPAPAPGRRPELRAGSPVRAGLRLTAVPGVLLARLRRLPLLAAVCALVSCPVAGCAAAGAGGRAAGPSPASAGSTIHPPSRARPSPGGVAPA